MVRYHVRDQPALRPLASRGISWAGGLQSRLATRVVSVAPRRRGCSFGICRLFAFGRPTRRSCARDVHFHSMVGERRPESHSRWLPPICLAISVLSRPVAQVRRHGSSSTGDFTMGSRSLALLSSISSPVRGAVPLLGSSEQEHAQATPVKSAATAIRGAQENGPGERRLQRESRGGACVADPQMSNFRTVLRILPLRSTGVVVVLVVLIGSTVLPIDHKIPAHPCRRVPPGRIWGFAQQANPPHRCSGRKMSCSSLC